MKVSLLVAADFWRSRSIPSKGVPAFKTSDGPNGARGGIFTGGTKVGCVCKLLSSNHILIVIRLPFSLAVYH
jgi:hypothetical protein